MQSPTAVGVRGRKGSVDDYFAGSLASGRSSVPENSPSPSPSAASAAVKAPPQPFSPREVAFVAGCAVVGVAVVLVWAALGQPRTQVWRVAFGSFIWLPAAAFLLSPTRARRHRFAVSASGAFVAMGSVRVTAAVWAFAGGTHHVGRVTTELLTGLLGMAFFGGAPLAARRLWRPERTLSQEMAIKVGLPAPGKQAKRVWLLLADGRRVPATVMYGRQLAKLPKGVLSTQVVDVHPR